MRKQAFLQKLLSTSFVLFVLWAFAPIVVELASKTKTLDDIGLIILLVVLICSALFSLTLWMPEEMIQRNKTIKWTTFVLFILVSIAIFIFVYTSWLLLVIFLAGQYVWFKRMAKGKISTRVNLTILVIIAFLLSLFVFWIVYSMHT